MKSAKLVGRNADLEDNSFLKYPYLLNALKNLILLCLVGLYRLFSKKPSKDRFDRFLVVSTTGLGDSIWGTPAIRALRGRFPDSYIALLTSHVGATVLKGNPYIDEVFIVGEPPISSLFRLYSEIKKRAIDTALVFHASQRSVLPFCHLIGACEVIGTENINKGLESLLTKKTARKPEHEISRRLAIVAEAGAEPQNQAMEVFLTLEDERSADQFLEEHNIPDYLPLVGLHPGAKDLFKQWPPEGFIAVGKRLAEDRGCQIIVTGNREEEALVRKIAEAIPRAIPVYGQLKIHQLAALQKRMNLLITNDTGPMHLAAAVGTPLLALFGPTDPMLCGPISGGKVSQLAVKATCTPCFKKKCREPFCMLQIGPNEVYAKAISLLDDNA